MNRYFALITVAALGSAMMVAAPARADLDPWTKFCLINSDAEDFEACENGWVEDSRRGGSNKLMIAPNTPPATMKLRTR